MPAAAAICQTPLNQPHKTCCIINAYYLHYSNSVEQWLQHWTLDLGVAVQRSVQRVALQNSGCAWGGRRCWHMPQIFKGYGCTVFRNSSESYLFPCLCERILQFIIWRHVSLEQGEVRFRTQDKP